MIKKLLAVLATVQKIYPAIPVVILLLSLSEYCCMLSSCCIEFKLSTRKGCGNPGLKTAQQYSGGESGADVYNNVLLSAGYHGC
jgi:hypothetical protein